MVLQQFTVRNGESFSAQMYVYALYFAALHRAHFLRIRVEVNTRCAGKWVCKASVARVAPMFTHLFAVAEVTVPEALTGEPRGGENLRTRV
jgi:hypothetical protein